MSDNSICKTIKNLNLLDSFLFNELTENPENAKLIARITPIFYENTRLLCGG